MRKAQSTVTPEKQKPQTERRTVRSREKASRFALLGMLSFGGQRSGYDLKRAIASSTANFWSESYGNIYPRLHELMADALIRPQASAKADTGRKKQLYSITSKGRQALAAWLGEPVAPRHEDNELLLKLFFGSMMPVQAAVDLVRESRAHHERLLQQFDFVERSILNGPLDKQEKSFLQITVNYGRTVSEALVGWANQTEGHLKRLPSTLSEQ